MTKISFVRDLSVQGAVYAAPQEEADTDPIEVTIFNEADKSDPFNQYFTIGFRVGQRIGGRAIVQLDWRQGLQAGMEQAVAALLILAAEHGAEIRDALALERAE